MTSFNTPSDAQYLTGIPSKGFQSSSFIAMHDGLLPHVLGESCLINYLNARAVYKSGVFLAETEPNLKTCALRFWFDLRAWRELKS